MKNLEPTSLPFTPAATADLIALAGPPLAWVIPGFVGEGLTVLAGAKSVGKSWLALDLALAVATGGKAMRSVPCDPADVLYVDYLNGPRRLAARLEALTAASPAADLPRLSWALDAPPPTDEAFIASLDAWRAASQRPRLVVVDGPPRIRPGGRTSQRIWGNDHAALARLQRWANEHGLAVLCVCRIRPIRKGDALEADGDGAVAFADTTLLLARGADGLALAVRGRDVEDQRPALRFVAGQWSLLGDAVTVNRSAKRQQIIEALEAYGELGPSDIAEETGMPDDNVRQMLLRMVRDGEIEKNGWGVYRLVETEDEQLERLYQTWGYPPSRESQTSQKSQKS